MRDRNLKKGKVRVLRLHELYSKRLARTRYYDRSISQFARAVRSPQVLGALAEASTALAAVGRAALDGARLIPAIRGRRAPLKAGGECESFFESIFPRVQRYHHRINKKRTYILHGIDDQIFHRHL